MQKRAVLVCAVATLLGLLTVVLGFAAEHFQKKAFVGSDASRCHYRRTQALGCGVLAALLSLAAVALVTAAAGCFCCSAGARRRGCARTACAVVAWLQVVSAAAAFLYGASRNAGGEGGFTPVRRQPERDSPGGGGFDFVCDDLRDGVFVSASVTAAIGVFCAITAYVDALQHRSHRAPTPTLGVAMEPQQPPVAYPAQAPPNGRWLLRRRQATCRDRDSFFSLIDNIGSGVCARALACFSVAMSYVLLFVLLCAGLIKYFANCVSGAPWKAHVSQTRL